MGIVREPGSQGSDVLAIELDHIGLLQTDRVLQLLVEKISRLFDRLADSKSFVSVHRRSIAHSHFIPQVGLKVNPCKINGLGLSG